MVSRKAHNVQILVYHSVSDKLDGSSYNIASDVFENHLKYLMENEYSCILVDDYWQLLIDSRSKDLSQKSVLITFDDGYESNFTNAFPLLQKYGFQASFFITTDWIDKPGYMTKDQLKMLKISGMSVQSHAKSHRYLSDISELELVRELRGSGDRLKEVLGEDARFLSFPGGRYNNKTLDCALRVGYSAVFTTKPFTLTNNHKLGVIGRYCVKPGISLDHFERMVAGDFFTVFKTKIFYSAKLLLKKTLGNKLYYSLWQKYGRSLS